MRKIGLYVNWTQFMSNLADKGETMCLIISRLDKEIHLVRKKKE